MFPENLRLICKKCFKAMEMPPHSGRINCLICPHCEIEHDFSGESYERFSKYYFRLLSSIEALKDNGFMFIGYTVDVLEHRGDRYLVFLSNFEIQCLSCEKTTTYRVNRINKFRKEPGLFLCRKCGALPKRIKDIKEFCMCLWWTNKVSLSKFVSVYWDAFYPGRIDYRDFLTRDQKEIHSHVKFPQP